MFARHRYEPYRTIINHHHGPAVTNLSLCASLQGMGADAAANLLERAGLQATADRKKPTTAIISNGWWWVGACSWPAKDAHYGDLWLDDGD